MPSHDETVTRITQIPGYRAEFDAVFGKDGALTIGNTVKAIAAFERTLITPSSRYDRYIEGDTSALTAQQVRGMKTFDSTGCTSCHSGPAFNGAQFGKPLGHGVFEDFPAFRDNDYVKKYKLAEDRGRYEVTKKAADKNRFKVPILRNITLTAPYFHNGSVKTLEEAVRVMAVTELGTELSDRDVADIVAFLGALTGEFPEITLPRIPSKSGASVLTRAKVGPARD
jgi:cytochrome c peroxidase